MKLYAIVSGLVCAAGLTLTGADLASLLVPVSEMRQDAGVAIATVAPKPAATPVAEAVAQPAKDSLPDILITLDDVTNALRDALISRYAVEGTLKVDPVQQWKSVRVKNAEWRTEILRVSTQTLAPRMTVGFRLYAGETRIGDYQMQVTCTLMREVLVATRRFERGETISANDFDVQVRDVLDDRGAPVVSGSAIDGYRTRGILGAGQLLSWRDIEEKPMVSKGQIVEAVANEGKMRIAIKALVLEDGKAGEMILVRNLSSNKEIQARILNEHTVQVYF